MKVKPTKAKERKEVIDDYKNRKRRRRRRRRRRSLINFLSLSLSLFLSLVDLSFSAPQPYLLTLAHTLKR